MPYLIIMLTMNYLEYGQTIRANLKTDVSSANSYQINLRPQNGAKIEKVATLGTSNITEGDESWIANEYVEYVIEANILDQVGQWQKQGVALFTNSQTIGDYERFTVKQ